NAARDSRARSTIGFLRHPLPGLCRAAAPLASAQRRQERGGRAKVAAVQSTISLATRRQAALAAPTIAGTSLRAAGASAAKLREAMKVRSGMRTSFAVISIRHFGAPSPP